MADEILGPWALFQDHPCTDTLLINFSYRAVPEGRFSQYLIYGALPYARLFLNGHDADWYRRGVAPFGDTPEETALAIRRFAAGRGFRRLIVAGFSKGAYGALLHGALMDADAVIAIGAELVIRCPFGRSIVSTAGAGDTRYDSLLPVLAARPGLRAFLLAGGEDVSDVLHGAIWQELAGRRATFLGCGHAAVAVLLGHGLLPALFAEALDGTGPLTVTRPLARPFETSGTLDGYPGDRAMSVDEALAAVSALGARMPDNQPFARALGGIMRHHGRLEEALGWFTRAHALAPHDPDARQALARLLVKLDRAGEAAVLLADSDAPADLMVVARGALNAGDWAAALKAAERAGEGGGETAPRIAAKARAGLARMKGQVGASTTPPPSREHEE